MKNNKQIKQIKGFLLLLVVLSASLFIPSVLADNDAFLTLTLLSQDPGPAKQGEYMDLRWKVMKSGQDIIEDISFELVEGYPFSFDALDSPIREIGDWTGYTEQEDFYILHYKVLVDSDALEGDYKLTLKTITKNYILENEYEVRIGEKKESTFVLGQLISSPLKLYGDSDENELTLTLENVGSDDAEIVVAELILPDGFSASYGFSTRASLGTIADGLGKDARFYVDIDETIVEGEYPAKVILHYKDADDNNEYKLVTLPFDLPINGKPRFEIVSIHFEPEEVHAGKEALMRVQVKNVGSKEAESVSLRAFKEASQPFEFDEKSDFVGRLAPGEMGEAILTFIVDDGVVSKTHQLDVEVRGVYNDEVLVDSGLVSIAVIGNKSSQGGFFGMEISFVFAFVLIVVIAYFAFRAGKRVKKFKPKKK